METNLMCSQEVTELAKVMINVQKELQPAIKDRVNSFANNHKYATLNSIMDTCREVLLKNDIWLTQYPSPVATGYLGLVTKITHAVSGQWQMSLLSMPLPKPDPQGYGSALTYGRRYGLSALLGLVSEEDDDAHAACHTNSKSQAKPIQQSKPTQTSQAPQATVANKATESSMLASVPRIDGVKYDIINATDGNTCITASGNTAPKKSILMQAGFMWSAERKVWWKYAA